VAVCVAGVAALGIYAQKQSKRATRLEHELSTAWAQNTLVSNERDAAKTRLKELEEEKVRLSGELRETAAQKDAAQAELDRARTELARTLASEIKQGEVVLRLRGGDLIVDVADKVLFDTGKAEVSTHGQAVLRQVAASIIHMPKRLFQVSGHTDAARVKSADVRERFPTNWELSTARATNVVRFLEEKCAIPGKRLVAAGYADHQPVASNATEQGKQRNRRIEIALMKEVTAE
jgi:chemotaxis protein MotB